jgi:hypothetical protein
VNKSDRIFSRALVGELLACGERPWDELRKGKPVTEAWVAQKLRPYGIKPRTIRIGEQVAKGYLEEDFLDTFRRYIPKSEVETLKAELAERVVKEDKQVEPQAPRKTSGEARGQSPGPEAGSARREESTTIE